MDMATFVFLKGELVSGLGFPIVILASEPVQAGRRSECYSIFVPLIGQPTMWKEALFTRIPDKILPDEVFIRGHQNKAETQLNAWLYQELLKLYPTEFLLRSFARVALQECSIEELSYCVFTNRSLIARIDEVRKATFNDALRAALPNNKFFDRNVIEISNDWN